MTGSSGESDYALARKEASEKNLPMLVTFGTENCVWCQRLDATTFRDLTLINLLNENFIPLKIDATANVWLSQALDVQSYPTLVFSLPDGTILGKRPGYVDANTLSVQLRKVLVSQSEANAEKQANNSSQARTE